MHIPKTGGSALIAALRERYTMTLGLDRTLFGDFIDFESMDSTIRQLVHFSAETLPIADVVVGHMAYSTLRQRFANAQFITVLREPFSRLLSHWLFWRGQTDENLASWGSWADRVRLARKPLAAFLSEQSLVCQLDNLVVRMLLGPHELIPVDNVIAVRHGRKLLSEARRSLAAFALVGLFENPRLSSDLRRWFGQDFVLGRHNETGRIPELLRRPLAEELTQEAVDLLSARSWLDLELWKDVARRCLPAPDVTHVRDRTVLRNIARYATLMSA
jgi:hypothetical protein